MIKEKYVNAVFLKDHVFMLNGKRAVSAKQQQEKKIKIKIPRRYWDSFAVKGIVKATEKQLLAAEKRLAKGAVKKTKRKTNPGKLANK